MSISINPGDYFILGFDGLEPDKGFSELLDRYPPAGILFLNSNYSSPEQLRELISNLRLVIGPDTLFAVDQEPGRVQRFKTGFPPSKSPAYYLEGDKMDEYRDWCRLTAERLSQVGINLNLAPVVDIMPSGRRMPVLEDRAFGNNVDTIGKLSEILIAEHKRVKVMTCAKHFPGLGSAAQDPHLELAVSDEKLKEFTEKHWRTFVAAVDSGVDSIMTTHLLAGNLDGENSATYSSKVIDRLRHDVGFPGPVISDDLIMKGAGSVDSGDLAIRSLVAGHDLLILTSGTEIQARAMSSVLAKSITDPEFSDILISRGRNIEKLKSNIVT